MKDAPCKDCPNRTPCCHAVCERYKKYSDERNQFNSDRLARRELEYVERHRR